jgi:hypothetical protein
MTLLQRLEMIDALHWESSQDLARTKLVFAYRRRLIARGMLTATGVSCGDTTGSPVLEVEVGPGGQGEGLWDHGANPRPLTLEEQRAVGRRKYAISDDLSGRSVQVDSFKSRVESASGFGA